jgi:hypothetical protein
MENFPPLHLMMEMGSCFQIAIPNTTHIPGSTQNNSHILLLTHRHHHHQKHPLNLN